MKNSYEYLAEILQVVSFETGLSIRRYAGLTTHSNRTISQMLKGRDYPVSFYVGLIRDMADSIDWHIDLSEVSEIVEHAFRTQYPVILGTYRTDTRSLESFRFIMIKE